MSCNYLWPIRGQYYLELVEAALAEYLCVLPVYDVVTGHEVHGEDPPRAEGSGHQPSQSVFKSRDLY